MNIRYFTMAAIALSMFFCVGFAQAGTLFMDDFEGYTDVATSWVSNTDNDPTGYTVSESYEITVQVQRSPVSGGGASPMPYGATPLLLAENGCASAPRSWPITVAAPATPTTTSALATTAPELRSRAPKVRVLIDVLLR